MTKERKTQMKNPPFLADAGLPFGKPKKATRKEEKYPPLFPQDKECYFCGSQQGLERHHIFGGVANRPLSEKYGLYVYLCQNCHINITNYKNKELCLKLKIEARKRFFDAYGANEQMFYDLFGRIGFKGEE